MTAVYAREVSAVVCKVAIAEEYELQYMATGTSFRVWAWACASKEEATAMLDKAVRWWGDNQNPQLAISTAAQLGVIFNRLPVLVSALPDPLENPVTGQAYRIIERQPGRSMSESVLMNRLRHKDKSAVQQAISWLVNNGKLEASLIKHPRNGKTSKTLKAV